MNNYFYMFWLDCGFWRLLARLLGFVWDDETQYFDCFYPTLFACEDLGRGIIWIIIMNKYRNECNRSFVEHKMYLLLRLWTIIFTTFGWCVVSDVSSRTQLCLRRWNCQYFDFLSYFVCLWGSWQRNDLNFNNE